jgi:hypothetical protein
MQITGFFHAAKPGSMRTDESTSKLLTDQVLLNDDLTFGQIMFLVMYLNLIIRVIKKTFFMP